MRLKTLFTLLAIAGLFSIINTSTFAGETADLATQEQKKEQGTYIIGAGDILEITTWKEEDFSRETVPVRLDGMITFPLIDDIRAEDRTTMEIKAAIEERLKDFVSEPNVTVYLQASLSKKFYILGEVVQTGEYPLMKNYTVLQAFALAGGFTEWASKKEIILLRQENGKEKIYRINYKEITKGKDLSQNLKIKTDDTIIVP